jgi:hypothetical protein
MAKLTILALILTLITASLPAKPASNARVAGGMLIPLGLLTAALGLSSALGPSSDSWVCLNCSEESRRNWLLVGVGGVAATGLGAWLWVKGGERQEAALSLRF